MRIRRRTNVLWGFVLLVIALVVLAQALGYIPAPLYDLLLRAWPALLVLAGLSTLLRGRVPLGNVIALVTTVVVAGGIAAYAYSNRAAEQRTDQEVVINEETTEGLGLVRVHVNTLTTDVEILRSMDDDIHGTFLGSTESDVQVSYEEMTDLSATFTLSETRPNPVPMLENVGRGTLRLEVPSDAPLDLVIVAEQGNVTLNMSDTRLERMNLDLLRGDALVTLPEYNPVSEGSQGTLAVRDGNITIVVPPTVAARLELDRGGSGIEPEYDPTVYNFLFNTMLESRTIDTASIVVEYTVVAQRGRIRLEVSGS